VSTVASSVPAEGFRKRGAQFENPGWASEYDVIHRSCEAMMVILFSADTDPMMKHEVVRRQLAITLRWALTTFEYDLLHYGLVYAESLHWLAVEK